MIDECLQLVLFEMNININNNIIKKIWPIKCLKTTRGSHKTSIFKQPLPQNRHTKCEGRTECADSCMSENLPTCHNFHLFMKFHLFMNLLQISNIAMEWACSENNA